MSCCAPTDVRKLSIVAIVLLVFLRVSIGWQFLYEGLWKQHSLLGIEPWSAEGYLKNAKGPFRSTFRNMVDDPYEFGKLDSKEVTSRWNQWRTLFETHYGLSAAQKATLDQMIKESTEKLNAHLGAKEIAGEIREKYKGTIDYKLTGEIELYHRLVARYEEKLKNVQQDFQQAHLDKIWLDVESKRKELTAPVNELTTGLEKGAIGILSIEQLAKGPTPRLPAKVDSVNFKTIWGLTILGFCLIVGLFSRTAAVGAAFLLLMFYLAIPPWPGVPEAPGPEHSLIVNKNLIEIIACLALASLPSGRWFGLDALIHRFILRQKND